MVGMRNANGALCATILLVLATESIGFTAILVKAPSCVGGSSFSRSMRVGAPVSSRRALRPSVLELKAADKGYASLKNAAVIGKAIPGSWKQGQDYDLNAKVRSLPPQIPCACDLIAESGPERHAGLAGTGSAMFGVPGTAPFSTATLCS